MITIEAPAKLNLFLEVHGRRDDGFHELVTVMQRVSLCDTLRVSRAERVEVRCDDPSLPTDEANLAGRAARLLLDAAGADGGVRIEITKRIPAAAGLGGGSSDAAAALIATNLLLGEPLDDLHELAADVGSDVPFFLHDGLVRCTGRGTVIDRTAPAPEWRAVLLCPEHPVSTPAVFGALRDISWDLADDSPIWEALTTGGEWAPLIFNRLESGACAADPVMAFLRDALRERYPGLRMSGSGSTFFAILGSDEAPEETRIELENLPAVRVHVVHAR